MRRAGWGATIVLTTLACAGGSEPEFAGTWLERGPAGQEAEWEFGEDGSLSWTVIGQETGGHQGLRYEVISTGNPHELNITGFDREPMAGQTLYCIAVLPDEQNMRLDCRPGPADAGETNRPTTFSDEALDLRRRTGEGAGS